MKYFIWGAIIFVAAAVIGAFFVIGSPAHQRLVRFDQRRVSDLQNIQYQLSSYFTAKGKLPSDLSFLTGFQNFVVPVDPESGAAYSYLVQGEKKFQLCAEFTLSSDQNPLMPKDNWRYLAGHSCFDLSVDYSIPGPGDYYPVTVKPVPAES